MATEKARLRRHMRQVRSALDPQWREQASRQIAQRLLSWPVLYRVAVVHCYMGWRSEVGTTGVIGPLLRTGKRVVLPRVASVTVSWNTIIF